MNYSNGGGAAMGRTTCPDFWPLADVANAWHVPLATLEQVIALGGALTVETEAGTRGLPYRRVAIGPGQRVLLAIQHIKKVNGSSDVSPHNVDNRTKYTSTQIGQRIAAATGVRHFMVDPSTVESFFDRAGGDLKTHFENGRVMVLASDLARWRRGQGAKIVCDEQLRRNKARVEVDWNKKVAAEKEKQVTEDASQRVAKRIADDRLACEQRREEQAAAQRLRERRTL
jgi:hypothetical protein